MGAFVGIRMDPEQKQKLQAIAKRRGVSLNDVVVEMISGGGDPQFREDAVTSGVDDDIDVVNDSADDLLERIETLSMLRDEFVRQQTLLEKDDQSCGIFELFTDKKAEEWRRKLDRVKKQIAKCDKKIQQLADRILDEPIGEAPEEPEPDEVEEELPEGEGEEQDEPAPAPKRDGKKKGNGESSARES